MISIEELQKINPELLEMAEAPSRELVDEYLLEVGNAMTRRAERRQSHQRRMAAYRRIQAPRKRIRKHMRPFPQ